MTVPASILANRCCDFLRAGLLCDAWLRTLLHLFFDLVPAAQLLVYLSVFFKDTKHLDSLPLRLIRMGLWLGVLSTLMPIGIGILSAKRLNGSEAYQSIVYTFLHLQYNGWFLFVLLGLYLNCWKRMGYTTIKVREKCSISSSLLRFFRRSDCHCSA